jgi:hypothetical protein
VCLRRSKTGLKKDRHIRISFPTAREPRCLLRRTTMSICIATLSTIMTTIATATLDWPASASQ